MTREAEAPVDPLLLEALAREGAAPCPACGYDCHGLRTARCPECGASLRLRVVSPDRRDTHWIVAALAWSAPLGFSMAGTAAVVGLRASSSGPLAGLLTAGVAVFGLPLAALLVGRRRFLRATPLLQRRLAWTSAAAAALLLIGQVMLMIRMR